MESSETLLQSNGLFFNRNGNSILSEISFSVKKGEFIGLIGPNGSGKTTLLKLLIGILKAPKGEIILHGTPLEDYSHKNRARTMAFMSHQDVDPVTFPVLDVILSGRYPYKKAFENDSPQDIKQALEYLSFVGLEGYENRFFPNLSAGEKQLVLFAKILMQDTSVVLLDEPTSNLDIKHEQQIFTLLDRLTSEGKGIVAAIHNLNDAFRYCDRVIILHEGRITAQGPPSKIITAQLMNTVWEVEVEITKSPISGSPIIHTL